MEMAHAIEGRLPFLDHHVAEYAAEPPAGPAVLTWSQKPPVNRVSRRHLLAGSLALAGVGPLRGAPEPRPVRRMPVPRRAATI